MHPEATAVYFPFIRLTNRELLKDSLLRWDFVNVIAPFSVGNPLKKGPFADAYDLLVRELRPSEEQKIKTHEQILRLLDSPLPEWLRRFPANPAQSSTSGHSEIYAEKFFYRTWRVLSENSLINNWGNEEEKYGVHPVLAHLMMATLARVCAANEATITDQRFSYEQVFRAVAVQNRARKIRNDEEKSQICQLAAAPVVRLNLQRVSVKKLVDMRRRERDDSSGDYRKLRRALTARLAEASAELAKLPAGSVERAKLENDFESHMADDLKALRRELKVVGRDILFSVDMASLVAGTAIIGSEVFRTPVAVLPYVAAGRSMLRSLWRGREEAFARHFSAYLFKASRSRIENDIF